MKQRIDLKVESSQEWIDTVVSDFDEFLKDHANCERKASAMAMSFVAKYPNRVEIIPELINTAVEELEHFRSVYAIMEERGIELTHEIGQDIYVKQLLDKCRDGREERFMDRLLLASLVETRGAERFRMVYEAMDDPELRRFYQELWASEAKHGEVFVRMALNYFEEKAVYKRLEEMTDYEAVVLQSLPLKPALH
ncbi:tRNA-(ms[2]io[6]A)-hydroxylase [Marinoscillum sp. 108]|jgi:tRNA-(ms[2]io[6]A)-hydroxylase|uniref:tRNA-(Ms[2]io[6]A)-hydroxylase n=1 Tax=Marinoscillum luteum TaxID=861051 RepID=A0ABW7N3Z5_9BACT|nr:tRNA-(ms[2]io[6]A)-hydroxylase [Marinoscillum sp. 108]VXD21307.1 tRNA-(Ms(2)io(6)A)-hydroxylase [Marinoscillum sp. 108]